MASDSNADRVLGHPLRAGILESLTEVSASSAQLAERFDTDLNQIAYHVSILAEAGFIQPVETGARRWSEGRVYEPAS